MQEVGLQLICSPYIFMSHHIWTMFLLKVNVLRASKPFTPPPSHFYGANLPSEVYTESSARPEVNYRSRMLKTVNFPRNNGWESEAASRTGPSLVAAEISPSTR